MAATAAANAMEDNSSTFTFDFGNGVLRIRQDTEQVDGIGGEIWTGSLLLGEFLAARPHLVSKKAVVELGAGSALVGLVAGQLGASRVVAAAPAKPARGQVGLLLEPRHPCRGARGGASSRRDETAPPRHHLLPPVPAARAGSRGASKVTLLIV